MTDPVTKNAAATSGKLNLESVMYRPPKGSTHRIKADTNAGKRPYFFRE